MRSSTSPASRKQFANSMPASTRGRSTDRVVEKADAAPLASSATFTATGSPHNPPRTTSKDGRMAPHRPAAAKIKTTRLGRQSPQQEPSSHNATGKLLNAKATTTARTTYNNTHAATGTAGATTAAAGLTSAAPFSFDVNPPTLIFDSYEANTTYTATLELKNRTAFNKHVRVDRPHACTAFELSAPRGAESSSKVAPGLSVTYTVSFTPTSHTKDYEADLVVRTEDEEPLIVPVRAYASRGCLHLPAELTLKPAPMKGSSTTPLFLRNTSERACIWRAMVLDPSGAAVRQTCGLDGSDNDDGGDGAAGHRLSSCFSITPHNGVVEPLCAVGGQAVTVAPVTLHFHPDPHLRSAATCHGLLRFFLGPEGDVVQDVRLSAAAVELRGVVLEEGEVTLADTYVTTERQTVVRVRNESDETIFFAWKSAFRDSLTDEAEDEYNDDDAVAGRGGRSGIDDGHSGYGSYGNTNRGEGQRDSRKQKRPTRPGVAETHQRPQLQVLAGTDGGHVASPHQTITELYEGDEAFQIQPLSGVLYGRGTREFTITFNPHLAVPYESVAYLDVTGSTNRLPLLMRGHGVGPQCKLEYNRLDIGDVYLNAVHEYTVTMENTCAIECQYIVMPPVPIAANGGNVNNAAAALAGQEMSVTPAVDFASKFHFTPSHGSLAPGEVVKLRIELKSDRIGSFAETFHVHMQGAVEEVPLLLKGRVLGPHFQCDVDELDFGNVSYNMEHTRTMHIENTSPIPMHYTLHLPDDCAYADDFVISPADGVIAPRSTEAVEVLFRSRTVGDYETALLVEVADVGDVLDAIPLKATCMVPTLHSSTTELTFGGVFVGYPTTLNVAISNDTALTGMFNLQLLNAEALTEVVMVELPVSGDHDDGVHWISPHQTLQLPVTLTALRPGRLHFSLALHVLGRDVSEPDAAPLTILVSAVASGPHVELQPSNVQFGTLAVLTEEVRELTLKNTSPVPAPFALLFNRYGTVTSAAAEASVMSLNGGVAAMTTAEDAAPAASTLPFPRVPVFTVEPAEGVLEPHSSLTVRVRAKPDDAIAFVDTLRLRRTPVATASDSANNSAIEAQTTSKKDSAADAGANAASSENDVTVSVKVTGHGVPILADRTLESIDLGDVLTTLPVAETVTLHNYGRRDQEVQWQNTRGTKVKDGESPITFTYKPERASIPAGGSAVFALCGSCAEVGVRSDTFTLKQSGTFKEVLRSTVKATFIAPTLSCSSRTINFEYANTAAAPASTTSLETATASAPAAPALVKSLTMKNITSKTLVVALRIKSTNNTTTAATTSSSGSGSKAAATSPKGSPFTLEGPPTVTLASGESYVVGVRCNPLYRGDFTSHTAKAKLQLSFAEHDRKEFVSLSAVLHFPAVVLNPSSVVDFGTVLTNTEQRRSIELHNPSHDLPARFCWSLLRPHGGSTAAGAAGAAVPAASPIEDGNNNNAATSAAATAGVPAEAKKGSVDSAGEATLPTRAASAATSTGGAVGASPSATKLNGFDIIPFSGTLLPGERTVVEVAFQGVDMGTALAVAVCHIEGGPTYTLDLRAAANVVQAHCDKTHIDFGRLPFYESASKVVTLTNTTQVHVPWQVDLSKVRHPECLRVSPMSGVLRDKARLQITFSPQVPDAFEEEMWVRIGHLDPRPIHVVGSGYMCSVALATTTTAAAAGVASKGAASATGGAGGSGSSSAVQVYRAPFTAFTAALQEVEARLATTPLQSGAPGSTTSPAELPVVLQKDWATLEAERLAFCRAIREKVGSTLDQTSVAPGKPRAGGAASTSLSSAPPSPPPLFLAPRAMHRNSATAQRSSGSSATKLVLARYIVDFGHLTRHDVRKAKVTIANPSTEGVNIVLDSKELAKLPVSVEPVKGFKVAAFETTTMELTMDATKPESLVPHGENAHEFTLDIKNGPAVVIECRCYVATPSLRAKEKEVDFGAVLLGEVKVLPVVLTNPEAVACPWRVTCKELIENEAGSVLGRQSSRVEAREDDASRAAPTAAAADEKSAASPRSARRGVGVIGVDDSAADENGMPEFWVKQDRGVVPASGSLTIEVYYAPRNSRARNTEKSPATGTSAAAGAAAPVVVSAAQLKFRCGTGASSSLLSVKLTGTARHYQLRLSSEQLRLPPARPHQVLHESVTLANDEDHPVEVFTVGLDARAANEVKLLRRALAIDPNHEVLLPPIKAGDYLPDALLEKVFQRVHTDSAALTAVAQPFSDSEAGAAAGAGGGEGVGATGATSNATSTAAAGSAGAGEASGNRAASKARSSTAGSSRGASGSGKGGARGGRRESRRASAKVPGGDAAGVGGGVGGAQGTANGTGGSASEAAEKAVQPSLVLLVGPPRSGKTCLAQTWRRAAPNATHLVDLDALIRAEAERDDTANAAVARCLLTRLAEEKDAAATGTATAGSTANAAAAASDEASSPAAAGKDSKAAAEACEACVPALVRDLLQSFLTSAINHAKSEFITNATSSSALASATALTSAPLRFVVDGLRCGVLANQWTLYELLNSVCAALRIPVHVISLQVSTPMSNVRAARALAAHHEARVAAAALTPIGEAAYEALSKAERDDYNRRLKYMNDCRRDLQAAQQEQRNWAAQLPHPSVQAELEDSLRQQHAEAALESTARSNKAGKGAAPTKSAGEDKTAGSGDQQEWRSLDAAGQFCAWYKRFLLKYGCPPTGSTDEKANAAAGGAAAGAAAAGGNSGRPAASAKSGGGAAAAASAAAQEFKTGWSQVLSVPAETTEVAAVAENVNVQLALQRRTSEDDYAAATAVAGANELSAAATGGGNGLGAGAAAGSPAAPGAAHTTQVSPAGGTPEALVSQLGEWFYLNDARLRYWSADRAVRGRGASVSSVAGGRGGATADTASSGTNGTGGARASAAGTTAADSASAAETSTLTANSVVRSGEANANAAASAQDEAAHRYVRFFSTMEREVVPVKKANAKKKSVPSVVLQKEEVTRWTLPAHSSVTLTLEFCSDHVGKFTERCVFGVVGSLQQLCLTVTAAVALPDISRDPKDIFPVVKPRLGAGGGSGANANVARRLAKVYIASKKVFDFGALLIAPPPAAKGRRRSNTGISSVPPGVTASAEKTSVSPGTAGRVSSADHARHDDSSAAHNTPFEETLTFVNHEPAEAEVTLSFTNDKEKTFTVTPAAFTLQPGATQRVQLRATPDKPGDFTNTLIACIKDNPVPWKAEVTCTGARPTLAVNGAKDSIEADFGRLVLRRSLVKSFTLANDGAVPLFWRLVPVPEASSSSNSRGGGGPGSGSGGGNATNSREAAAASIGSLSTLPQWPAELQCSMMEGVLEENEVQTLEMTFAPTHPCLHSRTVNFLVSEVGQPQSVYETIPMTVKAEGYDVVVEWTRELQLGVLHVGEEKKEVIRIMNKCPYDIGYQLRMPKRLQKVLTIAAPSGTLRGMMGHKDAAIATIDVVARIDKEGELPAKLSMMEVAFFDVEKQELLYPLQTIPVFGEAWYTKYAVHPPSVSFGSCMVGQPRESTFELTNTGRFPIEYSLFNYREASQANGLGAGNGSGGDGGATTAAATHALGGDNASASRRSLKSLKGIENDFVVGAFTCRPGQGTVPVGGTQLITVSTVPSQQNRTHETVGVRVAQSGPESERYGTPVEISAYPAAPSIAADLASSADVETIFEEQRVVYRLDQLPRGARAFSKEERLFSFGTVLVGQRCEERFRIANSSPLTCAVAVQLEGIAGMGGGGGGGGGGPGTGNGRRSISGSSGAGNGGGGGNSGGSDAAKLEGFDLSLSSKSSGAAAVPSKTSVIKFTLPPFESRFITVAFTPVALSRLQAQLVATVDTAAGGAAAAAEHGEAGQQLRFGLCGEGTLPTVELVLPRRYTSPHEANRSRHSISAAGDAHLRGGLDNALAGGGGNSDKKKNARRRQGAGGAGSISLTNLHGDGRGFGSAGAAGTNTGDVLEMPLTRVGAVSSRSFSIRNTGCVEAQVLLDLLVSGANGGEEAAGSASRFLSMRVGSSPTSLPPPQPSQEAELEPCRKLEVVVPAGESQAVTVTYAPSQVEAMATMTRLRLTLADNPFEDKEVQVTARSFHSAISFEGIDPASADYVDLGDCYLGVDKTCTFSARNNTDTLVRYVWEAPSAVRITPSIGHLPAGASRTFAVTVCSTVVDLTQRALCALHAQSITVTPSNTAMSNTLANARGVNPASSVAAGGAAASGAAAVSEWDNSMQSPKWVLREDDVDVHPNAAAYLSAAAAMMGRRNLKQIMEAVPEPAYTVVDGGVAVTQPLTMGYRCSVPAYQCQLVGAVDGVEVGGPAHTAAAAGKDLKAISFAHTYLLQKRVAVVRLTNTGSVALPYSCVIAGDSFSSPADAAAQLKDNTANDSAISAAAGQSSPAPSWNAAQLSAAAAGAGASSATAGGNSPGGEALPEPQPQMGDFAVSSPSWTLADAAAADVHLVDVGSYVELEVAFTPRTVGLLVGELQLHFPHSEPREVRVALQGVAECPLVHFKVPPPPSGAAGSSAEARKRGLAQSASPSLPSPLSPRATAASSAAGVAAAKAGDEASATSPMVVEFLARGLHTKATVRFPVVNPTSGSYSYEWIEEPASGSAGGATSSFVVASNNGVSSGTALTGGAAALSGGMVSPFRCLTTSGVITAGRSAEAAFEFFADALGVRESTWSFRIPGRATVPFRLRGTVVEPNVYFHASKVDFDHVQVGTRVDRTVVLENCDDVPFPFAWDKLSLEGTSTFLTVKPLRGTIAPRERLPVLLSFAPQEEMEYNVPLRCAVKKSSFPLSINVKGVGICVHDTLQIEPATAAAEGVPGAEALTVLRGQPLTLDLDRVQVNTTATRRFVLRNTGTYPFHYSVDAPANPCVSVDNIDGAVPAGQSAVMTLRYTPASEETLKQCRLVFRIEGSVAYKVSVRAVAYLPRLRLSFDHYDFGPRFIAAYNNALSTSLAEAAAADLGRDGEMQAQPAGMVTQELQLTNIEAETIAVECGMATQNAWCKLDCTSLVVRPKETARLKLTFAPTEVRHYEDVLELCLNKVHTTRLQIEGEGVAPRVEVANPFAKLGAVRVGESRTVEARLQCLSKIPTPVSFARAVDEDLQNKGISLALPGHGGSAAALATTLVLKPKEAVTVSVVFAPTHRMSEFSREVKMLVCGVELPFVSVSGSCADAEVHLDTSHLEFRDVVIGASATRKVVILNSGDLSQKFSWVNSLQQLRPAGEWAIAPATGFVRAHTEVACEVRYTPAATPGGPNSSSVARSKRKAGSTASRSSSPAAPTPSPPPPQATRTLRLELDSAPPVSLSIDANAVTRPPATETVQFACRARESDTRMIEVVNTTDQPWTAEPLVDNAVWSCPPLVTLKPQSKTSVAVTYNPTRPTVSAPTTAAPAGTSAVGNNTGAPRNPSPTRTEGNEKSRQSTVAQAASASAQQQQQQQQQKDKGFFFIPLPDGTGRCVALEGTAEAAGPAAPLQRHDAAAHAPLSLRFQVHNWSATSVARFRHSVEWTAGPTLEGGESNSSGGGGGANAAQIAMRVLESDGEAGLSTAKKGTVGASAPTSSSSPAAGAAAGTAASRTTNASNPSKNNNLHNNNNNNNNGSGAASGRLKAGSKGGAGVASDVAAALKASLEVPAKSSKEFVLTVTPLREGTYRGIVRFAPVDKNGNPVTGEGMQQFFEIEINARPAPPAAPTVVELRSGIRDVATFNIPLTNPLGKSVEFTFKSTGVDGGAISASALEGLTLPASVVVPPQSHGKAAVTFFPLLPKKAPVAVQCTVTAAELGGSGDVYVFRLTTTTEAALPERPTQVACPLGQHVAFALRFTHYAKSNTEFAIRLNGEVLGKAQSSFSRVGGGGGQGAATVKVAAVHGSASAVAGAAPRGQEVAVEFNYEPSEMGEERVTMEFVSPVAGTYTFPITATCTTPQRQGPFTTRAGQNLQLPFKNVFHEPVNIFVTSDSPAFAPVKKTETVPAHKTTNVVLQCKAEEDKDVVRGRVSIACTPPGKNAQQSVEWLYYVELTGGADRAGTGKQSGRKK